MGILPCSWLVMASMNLLLNVHTAECVDVLPLVSGTFRSRNQSTFTIGT